MRIAAAFPVQRCTVLLWRGVIGAFCHFTYLVARGRFRKNSRVLQLTLAIMLTEHQPGRADEHQNGQEDMEYATEQKLMDFEIFLSSVKEKPVDKDKLFLRKRTNTWLLNNFSFLKVW